MFRAPKQPMAREITMTERKVRVLIVDDEPRYLRAIQVNLEARGYETLTAKDGQMAVDMAAGQFPDLIILDVRMPRLNGWEACARIREFSQVPIILLTALAETADKVKGLDAGADDYVTKPFSADELMARVRAVLRRKAGPESSAAQPVFQLGPLRVDFAAQRVFMAEREVALTPTEYRLLAELARESGKVVTPDQLLLKIWGEGYAGETQLVWQVVHRLRHKLELAPDAPQLIQNKPGLGYCLALSES
jgi:DNA-binding response OmpR family regulator